MMYDLLLSIRQIVSEFVVYFFSCFLKVFFLMKVNKNTLYQEEGVCPPS